MVRRKSKSELDQAEIRYRSLLEKRDLLNSEAEVVKNERDQLNAQKKSLAEQLRGLKGERSYLLEETRTHKTRRNELQAKAKQLIELKKKIRTRVRTSVSAELENVRRRILETEMRQQTVSLTLPDENKLLDGLRDDRKRLEELQGLKKEQDKVSKEVQEMGIAIDDLFKAANKEHEMVTALSAKSQELQAKIVDLVNNLSLLIAEANKKHEEFSELKSKATEYHLKAVEMRKRIVALKNEKRQEIREAKRMMQQHNIEVRKILGDKNKLDHAAEEALQALLRKGKVEIRG